MKIVLITRDRPELTAQTLETMKANAANWDKHTVVLVFDGTESEAREFDSATRGRARGIKFSSRITGKQLGVGGAKNFGVTMFEDLQPDDILMFSDNDMYYLPDWDSRLEDMFHPPITQLGGWKHPYHQPVEKGWYGFINGVGRAEEVDAATGNCFIIRYSDWLKFGPFDSNALGPGQSEDFALSQRIKSGGGIVAALNPPVAIHVGLRDSSGNPATGWLEMSIMAQNQILAYGLKNIWLEVPEDGTICIKSKVRDHKISALNIGSGQRRFDNSCGWINVDCVSRPPIQVPDVVLDATRLVEHFDENSQDMVVLHHVIEHFGCGEADEVLRQCYKVLKPGGSLLLFVPDMRKLAGRWLSGEIDDFTFMVNTYGAYQGEDGDRHKWGYSAQGLIDYVSRLTHSNSDRCDGHTEFIPTCSSCNDNTKYFDWREIPGADIARDWWILGVEVVKE